VSKVSFRTVPEELLDCAEWVAAWFASRGFTVTPERIELGYPYTPTILCRRQQTRVVLEVMASVDIARLKEWVAYGKSAGQDFRVAVCVPATVRLPDQVVGSLKALGIGCYIVESGNVEERLVAADLAINVQLPDPSKLPRRARELLGPAYDQFLHAQWREGFEEACQGFESEVRRYLKRHRKRIKVQTKKGAVSLSVRTIDRMTMGQLAGIFERIQNLNRAEGLIRDTLKTVNRDRVAVVHHKSRRTTETRLRRNVGRHMWSLINAMREVIN